ncbi:hypothetical protein PINS_up008263 [Pythium insidiosum]|nr:hypothetical protein PINS_up008263 [Pythium insidiosum]
MRRDHNCEKACACPRDCRNRFSGCSCPPGGCRQARNCPCLASGRECDPDVCLSCGAPDVAVLATQARVLLPDDANAEHQRARRVIVDATQRAVCGNINLLRGALKKIGVAFSATHGWGAFALEPIRRNEFVYEYTGALISDDEAERRGSVYDAMRLSYLFDVNRDEVVDALRKGNKIKFANHRPGGEANLETKILKQGGEHRIALFAKRDIAVGEELFFDYGYTNETAPAWSQVRAPHNLHCEDDDDSEAEEVLIGAGDSGDEDDEDE